MIYIRPDYYHKFQCTADKCEATCCAGWQIVIDEDSMKRYETEDSQYGNTLRNKIDWEEGVFFQDCRKRCAVLKEDNLCEMYEQLGEESLCFTCANYPRHIEAYENLCEVTLAASCPEVARILLEQKDPVHFVEEETEEADEEDEEFDPFFFSYLEDARGIMLNILQDRSLSIGVRTALVCRMAEEMQEILEEADVFELADVFEAYEEQASLTEAIAAAEQDVNDFLANDHAWFQHSKAMFGKLYELEHLSDDWPSDLDLWKKILYGQGAGVYGDMHRDFKEYCIRELTGCVDMEIVLEQLLVYFVFPYFCSAVYDENVLGRVRMAADSVYLIYELFLAKWQEQDRQLSVKDMQKILYRYSRELEHSDVNLEMACRLPE